MQVSCNGEFWGRPPAAKGMQRGSWNGVRPAAARKRTHDTRPGNTERTGTEHSAYGTLSVSIACYRDMVRNLRKTAKTSAKKTISVVRETGDGTSHAPIPS